MHADRTNRTALLVLAVLLLAVGVLAGAASLGLFGDTVRQEPLLDNVVADFVDRNSSWLWPVIAVGAAIVVALSVRWLVAILFSTDRTGDFDLPAEGGPGRTTLRADAVPDAVSGEVESYSGVDSARARFVGDSARPTLVVAATVEERADVAALRRRIETEALTHARDALDRPDLEIRLDLAVTTRRAARTA